MKILNLHSRNLLFLAILFAASLISCSKNNGNNIVASPPTGEFIYYTVNGVHYEYVMPAALVVADSSVENTTFFPASYVTGQRIPSTTSDFARIGYDKSNIAVGNAQKLGLFAVPQTEIYPYYATSVNPIFVSITEYGNVGEFIAGSFSGLITGAAPNHLEYDVTCNFRVKRRL